MKNVSQKIVVLCALFSISLAAPGAEKVEVEVNRSVECIVCMEVAQSIDEFITEETTEDEILHFVENLVCVPLEAAADFGAVCEAFVSGYGPNVIEAIVNDYLAPREICYDYLQVCA